MDFLQLHRTEVPSTQNLGKCVVNVKILPMIILVALSFMSLMILRVHLALCNFGAFKVYSTF